MVVVPTNDWKARLIAVYMPTLKTLGLETAKIRTKNDGSILIDAEINIEETEAAGLYVLSMTRGGKGWQIASDEGFDFALNNHPSEGKATTTPTTGKTLTPEEKARKERNAELKARMQAIRDAQNEESENDEPENDEFDDTDEGEEYDDTDE